MTTWKQFKEQVEKLGVKDDDEVLYIDAYPGDELKASREPPGDPWWAIYS